MKLAKTCETIFVSHSFPFMTVTPISVVVASLHRCDIMLLTEKLVSLTMEKQLEKTVSRIKFLFMSVNPIEHKIEKSLVISFSFFSEPISGYYNTHFPQIHVIYLAQSINASHNIQKTYFSRFPFIL